MTHPDDMTDAREADYGRGYDEGDEHPDAAMRRGDERAYDAGHMPGTCGRCGGSGGGPDAALRCGCASWREEESEADAVARGEYLAELAEDCWEAAE